MPQALAAMLTLGMVAPDGSEPSDADVPVVARAEAAPEARRMGGGLVRVGALAGTGTCAVSVAAEPRADASVALSVSAPCKAHAPFEVETEGRVASARLDAGGGSLVSLDTLPETARLTVRVAGAEPVTLQLWAIGAERAADAPWAGAALVMPDRGTGAAG